MNNQKIYKNINNKWNISGEGYEYIEFSNGEHILKNADGEFEAWGANKNHPNYGLIYKNTHLEFLHTV